MSRLTSPMNREKRCEKQRCFIPTPSLSIWPRLARREEKKYLPHTKSNEQAMHGTAPADRCTPHPLQRHRTGDEASEITPPLYTSCQASQSISDQAGKERDKISAW